jgi:hypothetical protein
VYNAQAAVTDREDIDAASDWLAGRPETLRQYGGVGANVAGAVLFEDVPRHDAIEKLLSLSLSARQPTNSPSGSMDLTSSV